VVTLLSNFCRSATRPQRQRHMTVERTLIRFRTHAIARVSMQNGTAIVDAAFKAETCFAFARHAG
jgi:hypothetical protein